LNISNYNKIYPNFVIIEIDVWIWHSEIKYYKVLKEKKEIYLFIKYNNIIIMINIFLFLLIY
jgi:hypothetical protein